MKRRRSLPGLAAVLALAAAVGLPSVVAPAAALGLHALLAAAPAVAQEPPQAVAQGSGELRPGWILLAPMEAFGWAENRNRMMDLCRHDRRPEEETEAACYRRILHPRTWILPLHEGPGPSTPSLGSLIIVATPGEPVRPMVLPEGEVEAVPFDLDIYDPDFGYGPWFHQTLLAEEDGWYLVPAEPLGGPVWVGLEQAIPRPEIFRLQPDWIYQTRGELAGRPGVASPDGATTLVSVETDGVLLRPRLHRDMPCGLDEPEEEQDVADPVPVRVPFADLYDESGRLLLRIRYTRGC